MTGSRFSLWMVGLLLWALPAGATTFSFGTIDATDEITSISLAADSGLGTTIDYDAGSGKLVMSASVAQFNFANKGPITGITPGSVLFTAELDLQSEFFLPVGSPFPTQVLANFDNGAIDWTILDVAGGGTMVLQADFTTGLDMFVIEAFLLQGELTGEYAIIGGDADVQAAFGSAGDINASLAFGIAPLCGTLATCPFPTGLDDFSANPTMTLRPVVPEPGSALLAGTILLSLGAIIRRRR